MDEEILKNVKTCVILIAPETRTELQKIKVGLQLKSMNAVIAYLLDCQPKKDRTVCQ
jgi:hypothetical protein